MINKLPIALKHPMTVNVINSSSGKYFIFVEKSYIVEVIFNYINGLILCTNFFCYIVCETLIFEPKGVLKLHQQKV